MTTQYITQTFTDTTVTIREGQSPVIPVSTDTVSFLHAYVVMAINFLRAGCPSVQLIIAFDQSKISWHSLRNADAMINKTKSMFDNLAISDRVKKEEFFVNVDTNGIMTVSRQVVHT